MTTKKEHITMTKDTRRAIRQGDVLLWPVASVPPSLASVPPEAGRRVVARGEATGHHHSFALSERVAMFREDGSGGGLFLLVSGDAPAALEHQEHAPLPVAPGAWEYRPQREWSDADEPVRVAD